MGIQWQITFSKIEFYAICESKHYKLGRRLYSPSLNNVALPEVAELIFSILHTSVCSFFPCEPRLDIRLPSQIYRQMCGRLEKCLLAKLHP